MSYQEKKYFEICLGMQMFASMGEEGNESEGLDFLEGRGKTFKKHRV